MRTPISEAPDHVRARYEGLLKGSTVTDADPMLAIEFAVGEGYMPDCPSTPTHDALRAAIGAGKISTANTIRHIKSWALVQEERALARWVGLATWAKGPSKAEEAAAKAAERARVAEEAAIEARTAEILKEESAAAVVRAKERARDEIRLAFAARKEGSPAAPSAPALPPGFDPTVAAIGQAVGLEPAGREQYDATLRGEQPSKKRGRGNG